MTMTAGKRTNIALIILGIVSAGVLGYFIWSYLAPPPGTFMPTVVPATEVRTDVMTNAGFTGLHPYADLPIEPVNAGRPDPFAPFPIANDNVDQNLNAR